MKNKHYFSKALFATLVALFFAVSSFAQCVITVTDDSPFIEDFEAMVSIAGPWNLMAAAGHYSLVQKALWHLFPIMIMEMKPA